MKRKNTILILFIVFVIVFLFYRFLTPEVESTEIIISPKTGPFRVTITTTGELKAKNSTEIRGPANSRRARIYEMKILKLVPEGTVVDSGDFVASLDRSELESKIKDVQLAIQKAESQYQQAKLDCTLTLANARNELINLEYALEERLLMKEQAKYEAPSVARQAEIDYDKAVRALEQAKENYKTKVKQAIAKMSEVDSDLRKNRNEYQEYLDLMKEFTIYAPEKGMVIYKRDWNGNKITEGSTVNAWDPTIATLPDLSVMQSITYVSEVDIQKVKTGMPVEVGLDADPSKKLTGVVTSIANIGEQQPNSDSKVFEVEIEINESDSTLRPAMTTSNTIIIASLDSALYIPLEAYHAEDSLEFVYKKSVSGTVKQEVKTGLKNENEIVVTQGLSPRDKIFLSIPENRDDLEIIYLSDSP
ncbi:MAG: hypothetical protein PWP06_567 [Candidatus Marinimicrobia bacterium]|jgi:multidrug efflux pump subunit AcrA (membrane-fusion protein)|nr:hypothetical protein [Candidatus Neomarinimicrobiota bacterium]